MLLQYIPVMLSPGEIPLQYLPVVDQEIPLIRAQNIFACLVWVLPRNRMILLVFAFDIVSEAINHFQNLFRFRWQSPAITVPVQSPMPVFDKFYVTDGNFPSFVFVIRRAEKIKYIHM